MASIALDWALNNGMTQQEFDKRIFDYVAQNLQTKTPAELRIEMDRLGVSPDDVARATGVSAADVKAQYAEALPQTQAEMIAKAAADAELASRVAKDTTATQATKDIYSQAAAVSQGLLGTDTAAQDAAAAAAAKLKADADAAAAANAARIAAAKAAADAAAAQAAAKAAADKAAADAAAAKAAGDAAALKAAQDAAAKAAADKAAADAAAAAAAAAAKTAADKAAADAAAKAAADAAAKAAATKTTTTTTTDTQSPGLAWALANGMTQQQYYQNILNFYKNNSGLSDSMLRSEMDRLQISPQDVAAATGTNLADVLARYNAAKATTPAELAAQQKAQADLAARQAQWQAQQAKNATDWAAQQKANETAWAAQQAKNAADWAAQQRMTQNAQNAFANAPMTLGQKFGSYESIPIGAQYNPAVTPGGASPYSMVMGQMTPFQNPYANFVPGTPLGGYNPNLYSDIAINNANAAAAKAAAETQAANNALMMGGGGDANGGDTAGIGSQGGDAAGNTGGGPGTGAEGDAAFAKGGMVRSLLGPDPKGPDDGLGYLDKGEYVIKKSSVNKYGRGLLDMINEGKMPAKKIRSLLD